ncbi:cilia- and flagella-associated protein 73 [Apus apus]|uniref:cilia- and flagella-associated protein 73 n=1 Tax=Apus apus TaxID=8895 RepID=UPI0021F82CE6|nr:cilia- and flagella-associated protein 73 [Apus apus]
MLSPSQQQGSLGVSALPCWWVLSPPSCDELHSTHGRTVLVWDSTALLPSTRLLLRRREVAEVEKALQKQREDFQQRMEHLEQRRQQLGRRKEELRDVTLRFDAFFKASAARQERELRRAEEEQARVAGQEAEAARLHQEQEELLQHRENLARHLRSLCRFRDCLRDVLSSTGQFQDMQSMLAHFRVLVGMQAALAQQTAAGQERVAQSWARLQQHQQEVSRELLHTSNQLAQLHTRLKDARRDVLQEESRWARIQSVATQKTLLLGQIKLAVLNLFKLATTRLKVPVDVAMEDTKAQLDMVLLCMQDMAASCAKSLPREPGPCPPHLPPAPSTPPLCQGGARLPPIQEQPPGTTACSRG